MTLELAYVSGRVLLGNGLFFLLRGEGGCYRGGGCGSPILGDGDYTRRFGRSCGEMARGSPKEKPIMMFWTF